MCTIAETTTIVQISLIILSLSRLTSVFVSTTGASKTLSSEFSYFDAETVRDVALISPLSLLYWENLSSYATGNSGSS